MMHILEDTDGAKAARLVPLPSIYGSRLLRHNRYGVCGMLNVG